MVCRSAVPDGATEITIVLTDDREIRSLNREFRKKDKATDVLSFSPREGRVIAGESERELGDVVISIETALRQAHQYECSFDRELTRLLIHGVLHLCGFDHEKVSRAVAQKMRRHERRLLNIFFRVH